MGDASLAVEIRTATGKGANRRLRVDGRIPGVVYGGKMTPAWISVDPIDLDRLIRTSHAGINTLIDLECASEVGGKTVIVKELQREPVRGGLVHVDLFELDQNVRISVSVPIHLHGIAPGVTMGGLIDHALRAVELECLPSAIPDEITVDISGLEIGDSIHVSDLTFPAGVELETSGELSVVSVVAPKAEEEPSVAEELEAGAEAAPGEAGADEDAADASDGGDSKES